MEKDNSNKEEDSINEQERMKEALALLKNGVPYREINKKLKEKFGQGLSNFSLQKLNLKQNKSSEITDQPKTEHNLTFDEITLEECFQKKQYEPRRIKITRKVAYGTNVVQILIDLDIEIHLGNQYLMELEPLIKKYSTIKAHLETGENLDAATRIDAERQMMELLSKINTLKAKITQFE